MRSILLTGGTGKFGRVLTSYFLRKNDRVVFTSRSQENIDTVQREHKDAGDRLHGIAVDLADQEGPQHVIDHLTSSGVTIDCLINNARDQQQLKIDESGLVARGHFLGELLLDVVVPYELTMALAQRPNCELERVVNVGSIYGLVAPNPALYEDFDRQSPIQYGVAKAALVHLTKELAVRLSGKGIRVNCVAFGGVEGRVDEKFKGRYAELVPNRRMLNEREIPGTIDHLLSDASSGITGQTVTVDGGWTTW